MKRFLLSITLIFTILFAFNMQTFAAAPTKDFVPKPKVLYSSSYNNTATVILKKQKVDGYETRYRFGQLTYGYYVSTQKGFSVPMYTGKEVYVRSFKILNNKVIYSKWVTVKPKKITKKSNAVLININKRKEIEPLPFGYVNYAMINHNVGYVDITDPVVKKLNIDRLSTIH